MLKRVPFGDKLIIRRRKLVLITEDEFDSFYVIKILDTSGDRYFFSLRTFVTSIELAKKFNTLRSAKRSVKLIGDFNCVIEKLKRNNF